MRYISNLNIIIWLCSSGKCWSAVGSRQVYYGHTTKKWPQMVLIVNYLIEDKSLGRVLLRITLASFAEFLTFDCILPKNYSVGYFVSQECNSLGSSGKHCVRTHTHPRKPSFEKLEKVVSSLTVGKGSKNSKLHFFFLYPVKYASVNYFL